MGYSILYPRPIEECLAKCTPQESIKLFYPLRINYLEGKCPSGLIMSTAYVYPLHITPIEVKQVEFTPLEIKP